VRADALGGGNVTAGAGGKIRRESSIRIRMETFVSASLEFEDFVEDLVEDLVFAASRKKRLGLRRGRARSRDALENGVLERVRAVRIVRRRSRDVERCVIDKHERRRREDVRNVRARRKRTPNAERAAGEFEGAVARRLFRLETRARIRARRHVAVVGAVPAAKAVRLERGEHGVPGVVVREKVGALRKRKRSVVAPRVYGETVARKRIRETRASLE
jgi:hypothetical protein